MLARFAERYQYARQGVMLDIERNVCGCDYGSTSWTTQHEADRIAALLGLGAGTRFLDLGAGSGWPGLYLARTSGCDVTLVDIPVEGLQIAADRARADRHSGAVWPLVSDGATMPFASGAFDAIEHSDVLCCLEAKASVLRECRRVIRASGRMAFSVISIAPSLSHVAHQRAATAGPPFKAVTTAYPGMLVEAGWEILERFDLTCEYGTAAHNRLEAEEANATALVAMLGEVEVAEVRTRSRRTAAAIDDGLLRRELYSTRPAR